MTYSAKPLVRVAFFCLPASLTPKTTGASSTTLTDMSTQQTHKLRILNSGYSSAPSRESLPDVDEIPKKTIRTRSLAQHHVHGRCRRVDKKVPRNPFQNPCPKSLPMSLDFTQLAAWPTAFALHCGGNFAVITFMLVAKHYPALKHSSHHIIHPWKSAQVAHSATSLVTRPVAGRRPGTRLNFLPFSSPRII